ncbi:MAG TPA: glycosyltransferase family 2 protein [Chloroflexota bacterium]|nr:glycosyltransferase family 2 protein [Chloroflexota bacterium]
MKLSILIPAYNEEVSVEAVLRRVAEMDLSSLETPVALEIIVVDDCSTDDTSGILTRLHGGPAEAPGEGPRQGPASPDPLSPGTPDAAGSTASAGTTTAGAATKAAVGAPPPSTPSGNGALSEAIPGLRVIKHRQNQGKGAAIQTALAAATGDYVIIQDADFEYDPADIPRLVGPVLRGEARVVYGARPLDGSGGRWLLDFGNRALTVLTNLLYGTALHDMETCYKLLPTALLRSFDLECRRFDMEPEITAKVTRSGYRIHEVPISYHPRAGGKKLSIRKDGLPALQALLRYRTWFPKEPRPAQG